LIRDDVGRLEIEMEKAVPVQICDCRRKLEAEHGQLGDRKPARARLEDVGERGPSERLEHENRVRPSNELVRTDDVRVSEAQEKIALRDEPPPGRAILVQFGS
jgi:hypothetical protein